jgi:hypothetical protein
MDATYRLARILPVRCGSALRNNGGYDADDPDNPARTKVNTTSPVIN